MKLKILTLFLLLNIAVLPQYGRNNFSISVNAVYTTTAKIYLSPYSSDLILRNSSFPLEDILNPSIDFRYRITDVIILGFNAEYMKASRSGENLTVFLGNTTQRITVEDGFIMIPAELSVFYLLPFSTESFKFLMGAGGGFYYGEHLRKVGDVETTNKSRRTAYGIHVLVSMEYLIRENISLRSEMKFRDPQFNVTSSYTKQDVTIDGRIFRIPQESFDSKINVDGVTFILGAAFHF